MRQRNPSNSLPLEAENCEEKTTRDQNFQNFTMWDEKRVLLACIVFRLINALLVQTYFNPDEHWQATEIAHRIAFGYGHLTWEWERGLRSYLHPLIFAALYKLLTVLRLDVPWVMIRSPRLLQSLFAAFGDYYLFKLAKRYFGEHAAHWTLFCQITNWFTFFCIVRTFSNCLETILTISALFYWPQRNQVPAKYGLYPFTTRQLALALAAFACAIRPTSALIWLYIGLIHLFETHDKLQFIMVDVIPIGAFVLGITAVVDHRMYGKWIFVPLNFIRFNLFSSGGEFYGTHPWHWYFSQGFPAMSLSFLPLSVAGIWWSREWRLAGLIGWILSIYSFLGHKEFRFVLPALPLAMMFAGYFLVALDEPYTDGLSKPGFWPLQLKRASVSCNSMDCKHATVQWQNRHKWKKCIVTSLLLTNIPMALYMSLLHQRGSESVMEYLATEASLGHVRSVFFIMPCHSTPYYSFLHCDIPMRFLDCSPSDEIGYVDEADRFMAEPAGFLSTMFQDLSVLPSHVVLFDPMKDRVKDFLDKNRYEQVRSFFHAHLPVDRELQGNVLVYSRQHLGYATI